MIKTRLILIEGPPGSGKSTTAQKLAEKIDHAGTACQCFTEWSPDHPIPIGDDLHLGQVIVSSREREAEMLHDWQQFAQMAEAHDRVTVMESRFWQTSVMLMYAAGASVEAVFESNQRVVEAVKGLEPVLVEFVIDDLRTFTKQVIQIKETEWQKGGFEGSWAQHIYDALEGQKWFTERGLSGIDSYLAFLEEWAGISAELFQRLPFPKVMIRNPYLDWPGTMCQIDGFISEI